MLAYANLVGTADIGCVVSSTPCSQGTWESLAKRGRLFHQAELPNRGRRVRVWLTAIPIGAAAELWLKHRSGSKSSRTVEFQFR